MQGFSGAEAITWQVRAYMASSAALTATAVWDGASWPTVKAARHFANLAPCLH